MKVALGLRIICIVSRVLWSLGIIKLYCESDGDKSSTRLNCKKYDLLLT